jgi:hypothetical protein
VGSLLQTAATLQGGSSVQKAQTIAGLIKDFGVDIQALDGILAGQAPTQTSPQAQIDELVNQRLQQHLAPVQQFMGTLQQQLAQRQQMTQQEVNQELSDFSQVEFFNDLRLDMADIMEMKGKRGESVTLKQAYDLALEMNPQIKQIVQARKAAANGQQVVGDAASRAVSVGRTTPGSIGSAPGVDASSVRSALEAAVARHGR